MLFKHTILSTLMAFSSLALALPAANPAALSVRDEEYGADYKREEPTMDISVCKRGDVKYEEFSSDSQDLVASSLTACHSQSLSCLRKKSAVADESLTAN
jgi:hypothetical protein